MDNEKVYMVGLALVAIVAVVSIFVLTQNIALTGLSFVDTAIDDVEINENLPFCEPTEPIVAQVMCIDYLVVE